MVKLCCTTRPRQILSAISDKGWVGESWYVPALNPPFGSCQCNHFAHKFQAWAERINPAASSFCPICWVAVPGGIRICACVAFAVTCGWGGALARFHQLQLVQTAITRVTGSKPKSERLFKSFCTTFTLFALNNDCFLAVVYAILLTHQTAALLIAAVIFETPLERVILVDRNYSP